MTENEALQYIANHPEQVWAGSTHYFGKRFGMLSLYFWGADKECYDLFLALGGKYRPQTHLPKDACRGHTHQWSANDDKAKDIIRKLIPFMEKNTDPESIKKLRKMQVELCLAR